MSSSTPPPGAPEPTVSWGATPPEPPSAPKRRTGLIAGVTVVTLAVVGGGAFAAVNLLGGGKPAESALPATTLAALTVDLDPGAKQKVEALKTLRKFPELRKELKLKSGDDLRERFFTEALKDSDCKLTYKADIEPWIGSSAAIGAVQLDKGSNAKVSPVLALEVTDQDKAAKGIKALSSCDSGDDETGYAFTGDFAIISDSTAHAKAAAKAAEAKPLSDDSTYQSWSDKAGDAGIMNFYVSPKAADLLSEQVDQLSDQAGGAAGAKAAKKALANFSGASGALRFADGGAELSVVAGGLQKAGSGAGDIVSALPSDTAALIAIGVPKGWADQLTESLASLSALGGTDVESTIENQVGIDVPEDLETLLGDGLAVSLRGTPPDDLTKVSNPSEVPVGLVIKGDVDKIKAVIAKIEAKQGRTLAELGVTTEEGDGELTLSLNADYAKSLAAKGDLGGSGTFKEVVPEADKAAAVVYVDFDSKWADAIRDTLEKTEGGTAAQDFDENVEPLKALGFSAWNDGDDLHYLLKLTTD